MKKEKSVIQDFTIGSIPGHLINFAIPILLSNLMMILLNTVDMAVVGRVLGQAGTSAISTGFAIALFVNTFAGGFSAASQIQIAHLVGAGEHKRISTYISTVSGIIFVFTLAIMAVTIPLNKTLINLVNTPPEAYTGALQYSLINLLGIIPIFAYHILSAFIRGLGDSKHPFYFIAIACALNILLDLLFVGVFHWGVASAAIATVIAQFISVICSITFLYNNRQKLGLSLSKKDFLTWNKPISINFLKLSIPIALKNCAIHGAALAVTSLVNNFGVTISAFSGIRDNINITIILLINCIGASGAMIVGQNLAARKLSRVLKTMGWVAAFALSSTLIISLAFSIFPEQIVSLYTSEPDIIKLARPYIPIALIAFSGLGFNAIFRSLVDGSGNHKINIWIAIFDAVIARVGLAYLLGVYLNKGYMGLWYGLALSEYVPVIIGIIFFMSGVWKRKTAIQS